MGPMMVTSLTAGAAGFFSRGRGGCETGQSSPENVACRVFVGVDGVPAALDRRTPLGWRGSRLRCARRLRSGRRCAGGPRRSPHVQPLPLWRAGSTRTGPSPRHGCFGAGRSWRRPGWAGTGLAGRDRGGGPVAGPCCGSSGPPRPAGHSGRRAPVPRGGGSCGAGWRACDGGPPASLWLCDGCWNPAACGPGPVGRCPAWRRRPAPSQGWAHAGRRRWWRSWRSRHRYRLRPWWAPGAGSAPGRRTGPASSGALGGEPGWS